MRICVVIPVYNEARAIAPLVQELKRKNLDVFVIDDGSLDNSGLLAQEKGAQVLRLEPNRGKGFALQQGFDYALKNKYDGVIMMDGDGQHDVDDLDFFINEAQKYPKSIITGNRMANSQGMPLLRYLTNRLMSGLISLACHYSIPDTQCGYRYIGCDALKELTLSSGDFEIETEILMKAAKKGFKIHSVPVKTIYRDEESKIHPFKDTIRFIIYFTKEIFSK